MKDEIKALDALLKQQECVAKERTKTAPDWVDFKALNASSFVFSERLLRLNLELLKSLQDLTGVRILFAQKAYALYATYPLFAKYLKGAVASGLYEARLAYEGMPGREVQVFSPAFCEEELQETLPNVTAVIVNRLRQVTEILPLVERERERRRALGDSRVLEIGLRLNPEYSEVQTDLYNPAAPGSRLGTTRKLLDEDLKEGHLLEPVDGLHVHCLCEENLKPLQGVVENLEAKFADLMTRVQWVNLGGGHHLTRADYDLAGLVKLLQDLSLRYKLSRLYLEPGEAVVYDTGWLLTRVLDFMPNAVNNAILQVSPTCHTPDVLEMPYRPRCFQVGEGPPYCEAKEAEVYPYTYRLAGPSCLAGDSFGDYSFVKPLKRGDQVVFCDMALYAHVKTTMFNGMQHPDLVLLRENGVFETVKRYTYEDFYRRFGEQKPGTY